VKISVLGLQNKIKISPGEIKRAISKTLSAEGRVDSGEINVVFTDDRQIRELTLMYLGRDCPTDVIAFNNSSCRCGFLADIVVSTETALRQSKIFKTTPIYEVYLYVIHGLLHLLGYDDKTARKRKLMQKKAEFILNSILNTQYSILKKCPSTKPKL
jgi:probable rRNA maturation factor